MSQLAKVTPLGNFGRVQFTDVIKDYGSVRAVNGTTLSIEPGQLVTLLGPSGCGKTTTLRMIAGLELPSSGKIEIGDTDVSNLPATYRNVAMVFQSYALFPHMSVLDNVSYGLRMTKVPRAEAHARAEETLALVGLEGYGARLPSELSGGQQQRVAVARAVVLQPEVLLLDEPLSNLDAKLRRQVREEIRALQQRLGVTTIYVTHDQEEAMAVSDRIIVMEKGEIAQDGTPQNLYEHPRSRFIASFIGEANLVPCTVEPATDGQCHAAVGGVRVAVPPTDIQGEATLVIRPEATTLARADAPNAIPATVSSVAYLGDRVYYGLSSPLGPLFHIEHTSSVRHPKSSDVAIQLDAAKLRVVK
jgi:iron(III) transport system ATP-binding protein